MAFAQADPAQAATLEIDPAAPRFTQTERGVAYVFAIPVEAY